MLWRKIYHKTQCFQFSIVQNADLEIVILILVNFLKVSLGVYRFAEIAIVKKLQILFLSTRALLVVKSASFFSNSNFYSFTFWNQIWALRAFIYLVKFYFLILSSQVSSMCQKISKYFVQSKSIPIQKKILLIFYCCILKHASQWAKNGNIVHNKC